MNISFRPLAAWPRPFTKNRRGGNFTAAYKDTLDTLEYEISKLGGREVIIQTAMQAGDIRLDGWPRANARVPSHPGVIVSFESKQGPVSFPCDEFFEWRDNLRGIALTLERLRLVDLYGVTKGGEQYVGFPALPAATATEADAVPFASREEAATWLVRTSGLSFSVVNPSRESLIKASCAIARTSHPDAPGGDAAEFRRLQQAKEMLGI